MQMIERKMTKWNWRHLRAALLIGILFLPAYGQESEYDAEKDPVPATYGTRSRERQFGVPELQQQQQVGNDRYLRFTVHDGNLVTGGVTNSGLVSYHYVSGNPRFSWPKGPQVVSYIHSAVFYVAAEVLNDSDRVVQIVSDNYRRSNAELSRDFTHLYAFMPLPKYYNLDQPEASETPLIYGISEDVGVDGFPNTNDAGEGDGILQSEEDFNGNGVLDLRMQNEVGWFSISHRRETWPEYWPQGSYPGDDRAPGEERPGVRAGRWNGEYGAYVRADQESYYVMDDRENDEFEYYPFPENRDSWPTGQRGLGVTVEVRNYQWASRLSEDIFISIFDVTNAGKDLEKCIVGMYVDPDMGGSLSGDDASFDNVDDITYAWNKNFRSTNGLPMGYFGFAFLESPGLARDGIDNDEDGLIDESQNNGLDDDNDWRPWEDSNGNGVYDNEDLNFNLILDPGEDVNGNGILDIEPLNDDLGADGLGPFFDGYNGPDVGEANSQPDIGEPNFENTDNDESDQVGLTSWYLRDVDNTMADDATYWAVEIQPGTYTIRPGYQRDIAWSYGSGFVEFSGSEKTHRYAIALLFGNDQEDILRNKRTMQVIYDNDYNFSKPPRQPIVVATAGDKKVYLNWNDAAERSRDPIYGEDFEAYYIYKSTQPTFDEIKTITDAFANPLLFKPLAIYDLVNGLKGVHPVNIGSELGQESDLGITYNMGSDSGLKHFYVDTSVTNGRTYYYAIVSLDQGYDDSFYPDINDRQGLAVISPTECAANIQTDPLGRPISFDQNTIAVIPHETPAGWVEPAVANDSLYHISGVGTGSIRVEFYNQRRVKDGQTYRLGFDDDGRFESLDPEIFTGKTNQMTLFAECADTCLALISIEDPDNNPDIDEFIFDGLRINLDNDPFGVDTVYWVSGSSDLQLVDRTEELAGNPVGRDYEFRLSEVGADTSVFGNVTNFKIFDVTYPEAEFQVDFFYLPATNDETRPLLKAGDRVIIANDPDDKKQLWKWDFRNDPDVLEPSAPEAGDVLRFVSLKPFDRNDVISFTVTGNTVNVQRQQAEMDRIYVVPDPYVAVNPIERKVINEDEGRGDRQVDFVNLPERCSIYIFTASGKLVRRLTHEASEANSRAQWDLRTKDGLEIAHGIYFFVVKADDGSIHRGKFAVVK
jgi:hypothetical protein